MKFNDQIRRHHHITLNVGVAQEDYDFHTKVLIWPDPLRALRPDWRIGKHVIRVDTSPRSLP